jgi:hypothetical protein
VKSKKINIVGSPFSHASSSTWYKKSNYVEWENNSTENDITFYPVLVKQIVDFSDIQNNIIDYNWLIK